MSDLIDRQLAIDTLMAWEEDSIWDEECLKHRGEPYWISPSDVVENLPSAKPHDCNTCRYNDLKWYEEPCDSCTGGGKSNHWKPMSIESNRKMGKWVKAERDGVIVYSEAYAQCSECGKKIFLGWKMNYCPNCGTKMEGDGNDYRGNNT